MQDRPGNKAFVVEFTLTGQSYAAMNGGPLYRLSPAASVVAHVESQSDVNTLWAALPNGGGVESRCGWLTDRYGLSWQIIPRALPRLLQTDTSGRVLQAMTGMVRSDVAALQPAYAG